MSWLTRFQNLWRKDRLAQDLDAELHSHIEMRMQDNLAAGMMPDQARRDALNRFGNRTRTKEEARAMDVIGWIDTIARDLRFAARGLRRNLGFTAVAVLTLAIGIGASTAIFSAVNPILFEPLPYPHPGRILMVWDTFQGRRSDVTFHTYREIAQRSGSFDALSVFEAWQPTITGPAEPERIEGQSVSASYFRVLGVAPALGRDFNASEDVYHGPKVVILSDGLWKRRFGADRTIIGRQIILDGDAYQVVGVMPENFDNVLAPSAEIWSPTQYNAQNIKDLNTSEWGHHLRMAGRLRPDMSADQAHRELDVIAQTPVPDFPRPPWAALKHGFIVDSLQDAVTRGVKPALLAILGAVILVLLIACVNVTNLLLARGSQRRGEFALRAALGAGRARMIRQLLTESLLIAAIGGFLGIVFARFGVTALIALSPPGLPRVGAIGIDGSVFAFALGITTIIGLAAGLIPALHASRRDLQAGLQQGSQRTAGGHHFTRRALVVAEVSLALALLVGAGLLMRSLQRLFAVAPGFDASHVLTMQVQTSGHRFRDENITRRFFVDALAAVLRLPGVDSAAFSSDLPLSGGVESYGAQFEKDKLGGYSTFRYGITPGYFKTMGIPLLRGRFIDDHDVAGAPVAVLISESLAKKAFGDQDPIGQRLHIGSTNVPWYSVAGVVGDVRQSSLALNDSDETYINEPQWYFADQAMWLVVRARGDAIALAPAIKNAIWSVDKDQPIVRVSTMDDLLAKSASERRFALILFEAFGLAALSLAAAGIYGVLSGSVTERTREIGVRVALGASRGDILALIVRQGMILTALGAAIGLAGAVAASQAIVTLLFGVSRFDAITYVGVIALLVGVSGIACWVPAWRAARVDPCITLRAE